MNCGTTASSSSSAQPPKDNYCSMYQPWKPADSAGCCPTGNPHPGYSKAHPPVTICVDGELKVACSLTDAPNVYEPTFGAKMSPPTWAVKSMDDHIKALSCPGARGATGATGADGADGIIALPDEKTITLDGGVLKKIGGKLDPCASAYYREYINQPGIHADKENVCLPATDFGAPANAACVTIRIKAHAALSTFVGYALPFVNNNSRAEVLICGDTEVVRADGSRYDGTVQSGDGRETEKNYIEMEFPVQADGNICFDLNMWSATRVQAGAPLASEIDTNHDGVTVSILDFSGVSWEGYR